MEAARTYIGCRWQHQARIETHGDKVDCVGLLVAAAQDCGANYVDVRGYRRHPTGPDLLYYFNQACRRKSVGELEPGDVIIMSDTAFPYHVGICGDLRGRLSVIHAHAFRRVVMEEPLSDIHMAKVAAYEPIFEEKPNGRVVVIQAV
jgi:hypothetical protein